MHAVQNTVDVSRRRKKHQKFSADGEQDPPLVLKRLLG